MNNTTKVEQLRTRIAELQVKHDLELALLKVHVYEAYESLKPINLIKNTFHQFLAAPEMKADVTQNLVGIVANYASKLFIVGNSLNPLNMIVGNIVQNFVRNAIANNSKTIIDKGQDILGSILKFRFGISKDKFYRNISKYRTSEFVG